VKNRSPVETPQALSESLPVPQRRGVSNAAEISGAPETSPLGSGNRGRSSGTSGKSWRTRGKSWGTR